RIEEKVILPTVPATIKVIAAHNGQARLGFEAPSRVPVLREELCTGSVAVAPASAEAPPLRHVLRNRLNNVILGMTLLQVRLAEEPELRKDVEAIGRELEAIRLCLQTQLPEPEAGSRSLA